MIRYVLIVVLAATTLGVTGAALDHASAVRGEQAIEREIARIEVAATSLFEFEDARASAPPAKRIVKFDVPDARPARAGVDTIEFERVPGSGTTRVTYSVDGRTERTRTVDAPIQDADGGAVELGDLSGSQRLVLSLARDRRGKRVVTIQRG